jgi:hypothetical protein
VNCFLVERTDRISYVEDYAMVVVAEDELHAERCARWKSSDFKKAKLKVTRIDMNAEQVILVANTGA